MPDLPAEWTANRAELVTDGADGVTSWQIGLLTPGQQYIGFVQGIDPDARWLADQTVGASATDRLTIAGPVWQVYDRRDVRDPGNLAYIMVDRRRPTASSSWAARPPTTSSRFWRARTTEELSR